MFYRVAMAPEQLFEIARRRFDTPGFRGIEFIEAECKTIINPVPGNYLPFKYSINPYRGCVHACSYCASGDTEILLADGRVKPLAKIQAGDVVYGTELRGRYRRYVPTPVLAHWETLKPAFRVSLEDGTELITSGDHRLLTALRGWKHVAPAEAGTGQRPYLTTNNKLLGVGGFAAAPTEDAEYQLGYLTGMIRGDGHVGSYRYQRPDGRRSEVHRFRLALVDDEGLDRTALYLSLRGIDTKRALFQEATSSSKAVSAISAGRRDVVHRIRELIRWPGRPSLSWRKGFLAGIFDAEGSCARDVIRIANSDPEIIRAIAECLDALEFRYVLEDERRANGLLRNVRIVGGFRERLAFLHTVDPAITRKRTFDGLAIKSDAPLRVVGVESLGLEMPMFDITTGTGDFIANGVVSHNCFARPTHTYLDFNAREDFEREIVVKVNTPEVARAELMRPRWTREHVALGTNTDPYQWVEKKYELLPGVWEAMRDSRTPCSVLTKSPLLLRDIELFKQIPSFAANLSIPTLDEKAWRASEPHTPHPRKRIEAVAELNRAGIPTGVLIAPLMPGINDSPKQVEEILELCAEAGAVSIGGICLHLRGEVRDIVMDWLRSYRPDLVPRYESLYARGAYAPKAERERMSRLVRQGRRVTAPSRDPAGDADAPDAETLTAEPPDAEPEMAAPPAEQPTLF
jgi:DNA repair photolyase